MLVTAFVLYNRRISCVVTKEQWHARLIHVEKWKTALRRQLRSKVIQPLPQCQHLGATAVFRVNMGPFLGPLSDPVSDLFSCVFSRI